MGEATERSFVRDWSIKYLSRAWTLTIGPYFHRFLYRVSLTLLRLTLASLSQVPGASPGEKNGFPFAFNALVARFADSTVS